MNRYWNAFGRLEKDTVQGGSSVETMPDEGQNRHESGNEPKFETTKGVLSASLKRVYETNVVWGHICEALENVCHRIGVADPGFRPDLNIAEIRSHLLFESKNG